MGSNMGYVYVGKLVNTHGIRGEVRVLSNFELKDKMFKPKTKIYIGDEKKEFTIRSYRPHKKFDMFTFEGIDNINDILMYKGKKVYFNKEEIFGDEVLREDLVNMDVYFENKQIGVVKDILLSQAHDILEIEAKKTFLVPYVDEYILKVDVKNNEIHLQSVEVFLNED